MEILERGGSTETCIGARVSWRYWSGEGGRGGGGGEGRANGNIYRGQGFVEILEWGGGLTET